MILAGVTTNFTGNMEWTLYLIFLVLFAIGLFFGIPLEITATLLLPFVIGAAAFYSGILGILVVILLYISAIVAKNFLFR
jgi:hypothetical protein